MRCALKVVRLPPGTTVNAQVLAAMRREAALQRSLAHTNVTAIQGLAADTASNPAKPK
jgi:hypothetical protein